MSTWPATLPAPLRLVNVIPGSKAERYEQDSGRRIIRNWGHIPPDRVTVQFRIEKDFVADFLYFWHSVGMDVTWFTASWLAEMGYTDHKARILGYPRRKGIDTKWSDFSVTLLVYSSAYCVDAEPWLPDERRYDVDALSLSLAIPAPYIIRYGWFSATISSDRSLINMRDEADIQGYNGENGGDFTLTIGAGTLISSDSPSNPALETGEFEDGFSLYLIIESGALIRGAGGDGGDGKPTSSEDGEDGGTAIKADWPISIENNGGVYGGGGGGGGGGEGTTGGGGGGGGAQGYVPGSGGSGGSGATPGNPGSAGAPNAPGAPGAGGGDGGAGGGGGSDGSSGGPGSDGASSSGGFGGAAGKYAEGDSNIIWSVAGTRVGDVS